MSVIESETRTISRIEGHYLTHERNNLHIMLENADINWYWEEKDIEEFEILFKEGRTLQQLSEYFNRPHVEIALMMIDRELENKIGGAV